MIKKIAITLSFIVVIAACNKPNDKKFKKFPQTIDLDAQSINSKSFQSMNIVGLVDSIIVLNTGPYSDSIFYLFNKNKFSFIKEAGKKGKGPGELTHASIRGNINKQNGTIFVGDRSKLKLFRYSLDGVLNNKNASPEVYIELPNNFSHANEVIVVNDSIIIGTGMPNYGICVLNKKGEIINKFGRLPEKPDEIKALKHISLYNQRFTFNKKQNKFAIGFTSFDSLNCYNLSGEVVFKQTGPDFIESDYKTVYKRDEKTTYWSLESDDKYIYGLYSGKKKYEIPSNANTLKDVKLFHPKNIHIFDWQGNPKLKVKLDKPIVDFVIDKKTNRLIALSFQKGSFVVYDFKKIQNALADL